MHVENTTARSQELAHLFEVANREVIEAVERCTDAQWQAVCADEGWSVGVVAHHIAVAHGVVVGWLQSVAEGRGMPPLTKAEIDAMNRRHAEQFAGCTRAEVLHALRTGGDAAAAAVRALSDEALERSAPIRLLNGQMLSVEQLITFILIGHPQEHMASINATLAS